MQEFLSAGVAWAATYYIPEPAFPLWLWPLLAIIGIGCQLAAVALRRKWLLLPGLALTLTGAALERDITLAVADVLACLGVALATGKS